MIEFHPLHPDAEMMPTWNPAGLRNLAKLAGVLVLGVAVIVGIGWSVTALALGIVLP